VFKEALQQLADRLGLNIRIAHYPPYCSKHNPIERRLFAHVTRACQGVTFHTLDIARQFMSTFAARTTAPPRQMADFGELFVAISLLCFLVQFDQ
jgi:hypothetical protein